MALLKRKNTTPNGGWSYRQPETEFTITAENLSALVDFVMAHRRYKNLVPTDAPSVQLDIERQICVRLSRGDCKPEGDTDSWVPADGERPIITMSQVIAFSRAAFEFVKSGMKLVNRTEAERRAEICKGCAENRAMTGCSCGNYHALIASAIPAERKIDGLFVCWRCGCDLQSKVNLEASVIIASNKNQKIEYPSFCWQRRLIEDEPNTTA